MGAYFHTAGLANDTVAAFTLFEGGSGAARDVVVRKQRLQSCEAVRGIIFKCLGPQSHGGLQASPTSLPALPL